MKQESSNHEPQAALLLKAKRMATLGALAGGLAHDLNNVLAPSLLTVSLLKQKLTAEDQWLATSLETSTRRGMELLKELMKLIGSEEGSRARVPPHRILNTVEKIVRSTFPPAIEVTTDYSKELAEIDCDPPQLCQVLLELCLEAKRALGDEGRLRLEAGEAAPAAGLEIELTVEAEGISSGERRCWPASPSAVDADTVLAVLESHRGRIHRDGGEGGRWHARISLPAADALLASGEPAAGGPDAGTAGLVEDAPEPGTKGLVLLIDDDEAVRTVTRAVLNQAGYRVLEARDGIEGVDLFAQNRGEIRLVLTDLAMRQLDGPATIKRLRSLEPEVRIIAISGLIEDAGDLHLGELERGNLLRKPFTAQALLAAVDRALEHG